MIGLRLFALRMSFSLCELWLYITRLMPTPMMKLSVAFITIFSGVVAALNARQFRMRSLMAYYTTLTCGIASAMVGLLEIVHLVLRLAI